MGVSGFGSALEKKVFKANIFDLYVLRYTKVLQNFAKLANNKMPLKLSVA